MAEPNPPRGGTPRILRQTRENARSFLAVSVPADILRGDVTISERWLRFSVSPLRRESHTRWEICIQLAWLYSLSAL